MIGRRNLHMSAAGDDDVAAGSNKAVNSGNVAKTPVVGLPRPMEIGPQTPEEVKAKFGDRRKSSWRRRFFVHMLEHSSLVIQFVLLL